MSNGRRLTACDIPENFDGKFNFFGMSFVTAKFIEGVIVGILLAILMFIVVWGFLYVDNVQVLIMCCGSALAGGLMLGIKGVNGDPLHVFIKHFITQLFHRRKAKYNPRVKYEVTYARQLEEAAKQNMEVGQEAEMKSLFQKYMESITAKAQAKEQQNAMDNNKSENITYIFEDDIGVVKNAPGKRKAAKPVKKTSGGNQSNFAKLMSKLKGGK